ncbi:MAG: hypothetical protein MJ113_07545 [Lachnospiraceae bacterium]|nr:hypothetical protein [Lachnospiraceae bacterium]
MKKIKWTQIAALVIVVMFILGAFLILNNRNGDVPQSNNKTEYEIITSKVDGDLDTYYPKTPKTVMETYCRILKCLQNEKLEESEIEKLVIIQRKMFDEDFLAENPYVTYLATVKNDLAKSKKTNSKMSYYVVEFESGVEKNVFNGSNMANVQVKFCFSNDGALETFYEEYVLREDKDGKYKVFGWKASTEDGFISDK